MTILDTNLGSTFKIASKDTGFEGENRFLRAFMCLGALNAGFWLGVDQS